MFAVRISLVCCVLAACGGDDGGGGTPDGKTPDGPSNSFVVTVTCPATPAATVASMNSDDTKYYPMATTITQGQIVKFSMSSAHNVVPKATGSDPNLKVGFGEEKCFMFTQTGTYGFYCSPHGFAGTVTVN